MVTNKDLEKPELREVKIEVRTFPSYSKWLKKRDISPSRLLNKAIEELMKKEKKNGK